MSIWDSHIHEEHTWAHAILHTHTDTERQTDRHTHKGSNYEMSPCPPQAPVSEHLVPVGAAVKLGAVKPLGSGSVWIDLSVSYSTVLSRLPHWSASLSLEAFHSLVMATDTSASHTVQSMFVLESQALP